MENVVKKTKAMYFEELKEMVMTSGVEQEKQNEMLDFIDKQLEMLAKRKEAAARKAEQKRLESDALTDAIFAQMKEDFMTIDEIMNCFEDESITRNKVTARLGKLVKAGKVVKEAVKIEGVSNKRMAYRLA